MRYIKLEKITDIKVFCEDPVWDTLDYYRQEEDNVKLDFRNFKKAIPIVFVKFIDNEAIYYYMTIAGLYNNNLYILQDSTD